MYIKTLIIKGKHFNIYPFNKEKLIKEFKDKLKLVVSTFWYEQTNLSEKSKTWFYKEKTLEIGVTFNSLIIDIRTIKDAVEVKDVNGEIIHLSELVSIAKMSVKDKHNIKVIVYECKNYTIVYNYVCPKFDPNDYTEQLIFYYRGRPAFGLK